VRELRDYQQDGVGSLKQTLRQGVKRVMCQLPTGAGKTLISATIAAGALAKGNKLAFVCPRISLIDQTVEEFAKEDIREVGVIQGSHPLEDWSKPIQVCSIDTIRSRKAFPEASVVIFDEAHLLYEAHKAWMADRPGTIFIGLSATPWAKGLGNYFDTLLVMATTKELIEKKYLCPFRVFATGHPDLRDVKITAGDYNEGQLSDAMQQGTLIADIVETWKKKWGKGNTFVFCVDCAHAQAVQERFAAAGIFCAYQDARTPPLERAEIKRKFHTGEYQVVVSVGTLTLGVDWDVRCISFCRPTRSEMLFVQAIGRGLRMAPGKSECLILDHSDTTSRLGFVTDIHHDHLSDGKEQVKSERKEPLPKECKKCGVLKPPRTAVCPNCGFKAERVNGIMEHDGELQEVTGLVPKYRKKSKEWTMQEKSVFLAELKAYGISKQYKPGWAARKYLEKFGVWPDWSIKDVRPASYPSSATMMFIKSRQIAWAKSKRNEAHA